MYSTGFRRSAVTRTIAVALTAIFVSAPPLNAFAQLATTQHVERDSVARLLTSSRDEQHAPTPTRQRVAEEANAEKPVMPLPVLPSKLEWIVGGNGHDAWDLFDGDTTTPLTGDAELRVRLAAVTHIDAITLLGPAHGTMTVQAEDAGGTHPIAELSDVTVDLKAGEWRRVVTPGAATKSLVVRWTSHGAGPSEIGLWSSDVPRARTMDPELADRILAGAAATGLTAWAAPAQANIARVELGASASRHPMEGVAFHAALSTNPRALARAFLVYELSGRGHWTEATRQLNGLDVRGGATPTQNAITDGGLQVEEISPAWLREGDNEIRFVPPAQAGALGYGVRHLRIVGVGHAGVYESHVDGAKAQIALATSSQLHEAVFDLRKPVDGQLTFAVPDARATAVRVDLHGLSAGWHHVDLGMLPSTRSLLVTAPSSATKLAGEARSSAIGEIGAAASPRAAHDERLVVTYPLHGECVDHASQLHGFVTGPVTDLRARGRSIPQSALGADGSFSFSEPELTGERGHEWNVPLEAQLANGTTVRTTVHMQPCIDAPKSDDGKGLKEDDGAPFGEVVRAGEAKTLSFAGTKLEIPDGAVDQDVRITVRPLVADQVARMSPGIANVSPHRSAFRFGPHGLKFKKPIKITLPYDRHELGETNSEREIFAFFYDDHAGKWQRVGRFGIAQDGALTSLTEHFTDFINATIAMPDESAPQSFNPNTMKGIKLADPGAGLDLIAPPSANAQGTASLSYPIELPPGRNGMEPHLAFAYNSAAQNGWLGVGWNLNVSAIEVDTRFGVPRYDGTERYLVDGEQITSPLNSDQYVRRVEGRFDRIQRNRDVNGCVVSWTITDKNGTISQYGGSGATLADPKDPCRAFRWGLQSVTDTYGNGMSVTYNIDTDTTNDPWAEIYPETIRWTSSTHTSGLDVYTVSFGLDDGKTRPDVVISGRPGFQRRTKHRLSHVDVSYSGEIIRRYEVRYAPPLATHFYKSLVHSIGLIGEKAANELDEHTFDYNEAPHTGTGSATIINGFGDQFDWGLVQNGAGVGRLDDGLSKTYDENSGASASVGFGIPFVFSVSASAGLNGGTSDTHLTLFDVNGDGLPDPIDDNGGASFNFLNPSLSVPSTASGHLQYGSLGLPSVESLNHSASLGWNIGISGNVGALGLAADYTRSDTNDQTIVTDIDGDGFRDLAHIDGGNLTWYQNDGQGHFQKRTSASLASVIALPGDKDLIKEKASSGLRRIAPLVRWTAPYSGTVLIANPVQRLKQGGNGIVSSIYQNNALLWQRTVTSSDTSGCVPSGTNGCGSGITASVSAGDRIYMTTAPYDSGALDPKEIASELQNNDVSWSPSITYQGHTTSELAEREPDGSLIYAFDQTADFRLTGRPQITWTASSDGDVVIEGDVFKRVTSDEVTVQIVHENTVLRQQNLGAGATTFSLSGVTATVKAGEHVVVELLSDTPIDPGQITWLPTIRYTSYCKDDPKGGTPVCGAITSCKPNGCTIAGDPSPDMPIPNSVLTQALSPFVHQPSIAQPGVAQLLPASATPSYVASSSGSVTVTGSVVISKKSPSFATAYCLLQGVNRLYDKMVIPVASGGTFNINETVSMQAGDQLFVTIFSDSDISGQISGTVTANSTNVPFNIRWRDDSFDQLKSGVPKDPMSGGFQRWFAGFIDAELPFDEANIKFPINSSGDPVDTVPTFQLAMPNPQPTQMWVGPTAGTYIAPGQFGTSRNGFGSGAPGSSSGLGAFRSATTWNVDLDVSVAAGIGFGGALGSGETFSTADFFDFNGDRRPDAITTNGVAFGAGDGTFGDLHGHDGAVSIVGLPSDALRHVQHRSSRFDLTASPQPIPLTNRTDTEGHPKDLLTLGFSVGTAYSMSMNQADWIDVNGDGLPDYVTRDDKDATKYHVQINYGYHLGPVVDWATTPWVQSEITDGQAVLELFSGAVGVDQVRTEDSITNHASAGGGFQVGNWGVSGGAGVAYGASRTLVDLIDVNGDGLPDQVRRGPYETMPLVKLNLGDHFDTNEVPWKLPDWSYKANTENGDGLAYWNAGDVNDVLSYRRSQMYNVNVSFNFCWIVCFGGSAYHSWGNGWQHSTFEDIDGDGFVDQVLKVSGGSDPRDHLYVKLNQTGKTNLLTVVHRPLGGTIALDYGRAGNLVLIKQDPTTSVDMPANKWVMTKVDVDDGFGNHYVHGITYDPSGFHDRVEREDYGFAKVTTTREDKSTVEQDYFNHDFYRQGMSARTIEADQNGNLFEAHEFTYDDPGTPPPFTSHFFPAERVRTTKYYEGTTSNYSTPGVTTTETRTWDTLGNLTDMNDTGDVGNADDVAYHIDYDQTLAAQHIFRATEITAKDTFGKVLRARQATYDASAGLATETNVITGGFDPNGAPYNGALATHTFKRDAYGNIVQSIDPRGYMLDTVYDSTAQTYHIQTTDSFGYVSKSKPNYHFGTVDQIIDVNDQQEDYVYDEFGRLTAVYGPDDVGSSEPTISFGYSEGVGLVNAFPAVALTSHKDVLHPDDPIMTATFVDGLERVIQTKKDLELDTGSGTVVGMTVSGAVTFDARGRVKERGQPKFDTSSPVALVAVAMKNPTTYGYDIVDRTTSVQTPDGALTTTEYGFDTLDGTTRLSTIVKDANVNAGGLPGTPHETFASVRGSIVGVQQSNHLAGAGLTTITTRYAYDPLEELLSVTDAKGNITSAQYDSVARMIALTSPDAGLTTYSYDLSGNLAVRQTAQLRAKNQSIQYAYDFNRLKQVTYPTSTPVKYFYGDPGDILNRAGRIWEEDSEAGIKTYEYDTLGNVVAQTFTLNSIAHDKTVNQSIGYTYDSFGRLLEVRFPDAETVEYGYDAGGNVTSAASSATSYLKRVGYDEFEQRTRLVAGNGVQTTYSYDPLTRRLATLSASTTARGFQALQYKYDLVGNIDQIQNAVAFDDSMKGQVLVGPSTQNFAYDDLYQLRTADGLYQESSKQQFTYGLQLTYDAIGNILAKQQTSNQVALNNGAKTTPQPGQTYSSTYKYAGPRPHAPNEVDETPLSPQKPIAHTMNYDASGNLVQRDVRAVTWNEEDRIKSIFDNGSSEMEALYDGAGDRAVRLNAGGGNEEAFYFGPNLTSRNGAAPSKHVFVGSQRIATKQSPADAGNQGPNVFYFHDDHIGSTNFLTDASQHITAHEEYLPTGELWVDETSDPLHVQAPYLFTGKELDVATGLYYFGARYYDPHVGIWASPDPALATFIRDGRIHLPERLHLYGYAFNNPIILSDPTGRDPGDPTNVRVGKFLDGLAQGYLAGMVPYIGHSLLPHSFDLDVKRGQAIGEIVASTGMAMLSIGAGAGGGGACIALTAGICIPEGSVAAVAGLAVAAGYAVNVANGAIVLTTTGGPPSGASGSSSGPPSATTTATGTSGGGGSGGTGLTKAKTVLNHVQTHSGSPPPGYKGGAQFLNDGRGGGQVLPRTNGGAPITYKEYDVNPSTPGVGRGAERLVVGSDGSAYYTTDHYKTFDVVK